MTQPIKLYSKSSVGVDTGCKRRYYHNYEADNIGYQSKSTGLELFLGVALHDGLAAIAFDEELPLEGRIGIDLIATTAFSQVAQPLLDAATNKETGALSEDDITYAKEQASMVEGLLRGFYKHIWPKLMAQYDIYLIEKPMVYRHSDLGMMVKADLVLRSKLDASLWYFEYKSTSSKREEWVNAWETNVQLHSSIRAIEQTMDVEMTGVIVQGLYKGYESYGKQTSPFCYAYKKTGAPPFTQDQFAYKYTAGWRRSPTWELPGGVKGWVENMPEETLADQFPQTPPIFINNDLIDAFFRQQAARQHEIYSTTTLLKDPDLDPTYRLALMDGTFPQNFEACTPSWGRFSCPYKILCHSGITDPIQAGFTPRTTDHLKPFLDVLKEESNATN